MKDAIRLTNRTAIALRRSAQRLRAVYLAAAVVLTLALAALAVYWGLRWLPAVPLTLGAAALLDALIMLVSRSVYLTMLSQAICTEAAAREIRAGGAQRLRREQAISDLMSAKADLGRTAQPLAGGAAPFFEAEQEAPQEEPGAEAAPQIEQDAPARRRRRQPGLQIIRSQQAK